MATEVTSRGEPTDQCGVGPIERKRDLPVTSANGENMSSYYTMYKVTIRRINNCQIEQSPAQSYKTGNLYKFKNMVHHR